MKYSCCGVECRSAECFGECGGCQSVKGSPFWIEHLPVGKVGKCNAVLDDSGNKKCPLYACAHSKNFKSCCHCEDVPCQMFFDLKDPSITEEEHKNMIGVRVSNLKKTHNV